MDKISAQHKTEDTDPVFSFIAEELERQRSHIDLIASENSVSEAVLKAQGCILTNKYAEGYPDKRYYGGCQLADKVEVLAINRLKELFGCQFANVQPHSGSQANQAVFLALLQPGDTILGMSLAAGGHLTHGAPPNLSGKWFHAVFYGVNSEGWLDYDEVAHVAYKSKPKLIIAGGSAYGRIIDFAKMREIADAVGAYLLVDMAHFAGLVAGGVYPSPLPHAHVVTSTTHKTLRGPRGGIILSNDEALGKRINSAIFPGLQGGPLVHTIAAKAIAFGEALHPSFKEYTRQVVANAHTLARTLQDYGLQLVSGGTDSHMVLVDLTPKDGDIKVTGKIAEELLEYAHITCNKNAIPLDPLGPMVTSGIRLGTPASTTRGFQEKEFEQIGGWIADLLNTAHEKASTDHLPHLNQKVRQAVITLCQQFPLYPTL